MMQIVWINYLTDKKIKKKYKNFPELHSNFIQMKWILFHKVQRESMITSALINQRLIFQ